MLGRRKHSRYLLAKPVDGSLRIREEVAVEEWQGNELVIMSPEPGHPQERLRIEFPVGSRRHVNVRVIECRPVVLEDEAIRHRLRLLVESDRAEEVDA